ncbi:hypothetical protein [Thalassotalea euphylliae]|uniref:SAM-dependent methyltransferase n=1 Tax=Thalassotalea euphylliae TaxID=1655234 RepID=A0A3E0U230_9GAMM|nr:hypothetical protein [Thalassotalea euphylliae]REL31041.1 hypothetical protein DXX94_10135 [Thalassotalea euphylliae]
MPLSRHLQQGQLLYFKQAPDAISVSENRHFRWLAFNDVLQSAMRKQRPHWLTLPHQWPLMLPWQRYSPKRIVEFGLGGGNHLRFCRWLSPQLDYQVVESNRTVIELSQTFFALDQSAANQKIVCQTAQQWLTNQSLVDIDWLIFDIYQAPKVGVNATHNTLQALIEELPEHTLLSINFTEPTSQSLRYWQQLFHKKKQHRMAAYEVPHYQNVVVHLLPKQAPNMVDKECYLTSSYQKRWQQFHQQFYFDLT